MDPLRHAPPRENVRQRLRSELLTDEDFDAFCIDYFPGVAQRLSSGLNRVQKENLLLQMISPALINQRLGTLNVDEKDTGRLKTFIAVGFVVLLGAVVTIYRFILMHHNSINTQIHPGGTGAQIEKTDLPAAAKTVPVTAKTASPETDTIPPGPQEQPPSQSSHVAPVAAKPSRPASRKLDVPASRPGPLQINHVHGNHGNVTIMQNNN